MVEMGPYFWIDVLFQINRNKALTALTALLLQIHTEYTASIGSFVTILSEEWEAEILYFLSPVLYCLPFPITKSTPVINL